MKNWYILKTISGKEFNVKIEFRKNLFKYGLDDFVNKILIPMEEIIEIKSGKKVKSKKKLFSGYIFVKIRLTQDILMLVKTIPFCLGFISEKYTGIPIAATEEEIKLALKSTRNQTSSLQKQKKFETGMIIKIKKGPFANQTGIVEEINYEKNKINVSILIFGRQTSIELKIDQIEKYK